jgi:putative restriction endonuclease
MRLWVGVTDKDWFDFLAKLSPDEVNFWQPSGNREFRVLQPGELFLFKLHAPLNFIVGGGTFVRYSKLPASLAWDAFGEKNGVDSLTRLRERVRRYRRESVDVDPVIGCNVLVEPFFLPREQWIRVPESWAPNIVQGKTYDTATDEGRSLFAAVQAALGPAVADKPLAATPDQPRYGSEYITRGRLGQGAFRVLVTESYQKRCAVTGEKTLPVLEAAHIKPYAEEGPHQVNNGILLRSDLHKLFDLGYVTVTPELKLKVSSRLREEWHNGREYYAYHGRELAYRPQIPAELPARAFLEWHNEHRFRT